MSKITISILLISVILSSCTNRNSIDNRGGIKKLKDIVLPLDTLSSHRVQDLQIIEENGKEYLCFYNPHIHGIYFYSLEENKMARIIKFYREGENAIKYSPFGILIKNFDSIFIETLFDTYLIDSSAVVRKKYSANSQANVNLRNFTNAPILLNKKEFILRNTPGGLVKGSFIFYRKDMESDKVSFTQKYPEFYKKYDENKYMSFFMYETNYCFNSKTNLIAMLFPLSDTIYLSNGYEFVKKIALHSAPECKLDINFNQEDVFISGKVLATSTFHIAIKYDKYNDIYYLLTNIGLSYEEFNQNPRSIHSKANYLRVLDADFKELAGFRVPKNEIFAYGAMFSKQGLVVLNDNQSSEDSLSFSVYKFIKNEN